MLTASVENMLLTSTGTTLETAVVLTQYIVIISTVRRQSDSDSQKMVSSFGSTLVRLFISDWKVEKIACNTGEIFIFPSCPIYYINHLPNSK